MTAKPSYEELEREVAQLKLAQEALLASNKQLNIIVNNALDSMFIKDRDRRYTFANPAMARLFGCQETDLLGKRPEDVFSPEDADTVNEVDSRVLKGENVSEIKDLCIDGNLHSFHTIQLPILDSNGNIIGISGIVRDITERKRVEDALKESEERFRLLMEHSPLSITVYDSDGLQVAANRAMEKQWLIERTETLGIFNLLDSDLIREQGMLHYVQEAYAGRTVHTPEIEIDLRAAFGTSRPRVIQSHLYPLPGPEGSVAGIVVVDEDVTERKRVEDELRGEKEFIETALDAQLDTFFLFEPATGKALRWNRSFMRISGYTDEEVARMPAPDSYYSPEDLKRARPFIQEVLKEGTGTIEMELICKDGRKVPTEYRVSAIKDEQGAPKYIISIGRDITERKRMEASLRESEERFRGIFEHTNSGVAVYKVVDDGEDFVFLDFNPRGEEIERTRREDVIGKRVTETFPGVEQFGLLDVFRRVWRTGKPEHYPITMYQDDRIQGWRENFVYRLHSGEVVAVYEDVTERRRMEEEIARVQKLESLGILAGGIAHDFNNILAAILTNLSMVRMYGDLKDDMFRILTEAETASVRARMLTQQLLTFSTGGESIRKPSSVSGIIEDTAEFSLSGSNVKCELSIPDDLWLIQADEGQICQVIQNLVINADQAMAEGGTVKISARNVTLEQEGHVPLKEGRYVIVSVEDQGCGIAEDQISRIFDPFFSTKDKGRGLGLATCFSIARHHDGHIEVDSRVGVGTTFRVYLPAAEGSSRTTEKERVRSFRGEGKILLVDDEDMVRRSVREGLKRLGYEIECAEDGAEGIRLYKKAMEQKQPFHVVIMDLTIRGGMGGKEAMGKIKEIDPNAKIILASGYSDDPVMSKSEEYGVISAIAKPFRLEELGEILHDVIMGVSG